MDWTDLMGTYLGFGEQGYGVGGYGGLVDDGSSGVELGTTTLFDPDAPFFLVSVLMRVVGYKPTQAMTMMGPLAPFIRNFWILNEATGTIANDIAGGNTGTIPGAGYSWQSLGRIGEALHHTSGNDVAIAHPFSLSGPYTIETLWGHSGAYTLTHVVNDPVAGLLTYTNGVLVSTAPYSTTSLSVTTLFALAPSSADTLEFARIWTRPLTALEAAALQADPYSMFGATEQDLLDLTTTINFMKIAKSSWRFIKTYPTGETP
jgi:hypothetical protein